MRKVVGETVLLVFRGGEDVAVERHFCCGGEWFRKSDDENSVDGALVRNIET